MFVDHILLSHLSRAKLPTLNISFFEINMRPFDFCYKITAALQYCVILESLLTHSSEKDTETENETSYVIIESSTINNLKTRGEYFFS